MKKVKVAHNTVIYYTDRIGRRKEKTVEVEEELLEPENFAECQELRDIHTSMREALLEPLRDLLVTVLEFDELIDKYNKYVITYLSQEHESRFQRAGLLTRLFFSRGLPSSTISRYTISKERVTNLVTRLEEVIEVLEEDIIFPMVEYDYTVLMNVNYFIDYVLKEFQQVQKQLETIKC